MTQTDERMARLRRDQQVLTELARKFTYFDVKPIEGDPPTMYEMTFHLPGYVDSSGRTSNRHCVVMKIPREYPRGAGAAPRFDFKGTPVYHPNVASSGWICLGFGHIQDWHFGYRIEDLVYQVAEIIVFGPSSYNLGSQARSMGDWMGWIRAHQIPLYNGALFPDPTRKIVKKKKPEKPKVKVRRSVKESPPQPAPQPDLQPAPNPQRPTVRARRVIRERK
jgi:ubiquitin-protein ligase